MDNGITFLPNDRYLLENEKFRLYYTAAEMCIRDRATDVLTFSPNGDYVRVKPQPGHPTEE